MENYLNTLNITSSHFISEEELQHLSSILAKDMGIENFRITSDGVYLEYNIYLYDPARLEDALEKYGFEKKHQKKPGFIMKQIRKLADNNKETYGSGKLDCCK